MSYCLALCKSWSIMFEKETLKSWSLIAVKVCPLRLPPPALPAQRSSHPLLNSCSSCDHINEKLFALFQKCVSQVSSKLLYWKIFFIIPSLLRSAEYFVLNYHFVILKHYNPIFSESKKFLGSNFENFEKKLKGNIEEQVNSQQYFHIYFKYNS